MKILLLIAVFALASCSKDDKTCWECKKTVSPFNSVEICNDSDTPPTQHTDGAGNTYSVDNCKKR